MAGLIVSSAITTVIALVVLVVATVAIAVKAWAGLRVAVHVVRHGLLAVVGRLLRSGCLVVLRLAVLTLVALLFAHNVLVFLGTLGHGLNWNVAVRVVGRVHLVVVVHGGGHFGLWFVHGVGTIVILFFRDNDGDCDVLTTVESFELPRAFVICDKVRVTGFKGGDVDAQLATDSSVTTRAGIRLVLSRHLPHVLGLILFQLPAVASGGVLAEKDLDCLSDLHLDSVCSESLHLVVVGEIVLPVVVDLSLDNLSDTRVFLVEIAGHWLLLGVDVVVRLANGGGVALLLGFGTVRVVLGLRLAGGIHVLGSLLLVRLLLGSGISVVLLRLAAHVAVLRRS